MIDLTSEDVNVDLFGGDGFSLSDTIAAGSINQKGRTRKYTFRGGEPGGITKAKFTRWSKGRWIFKLRAKGLDLSNWSYAVDLRLTVGDDSGQGWKAGKR